MPQSNPPSWGTQLHTHEVSLLPKCMCKYLKISKIGWKSFFFMKKQKSEKKFSILTFLQQWLCQMWDLWWDTWSRVQMSQHRARRIWDPPKIINIPFDWHRVCPFHLICLKFSGILFPNSHFQPTPFLNLSNALFLTLLIWSFLSLSRSLSLSVYPPLCFHPLPFDMNTLTILYMVLLNKLNWTNTVFPLQLSHNTFGVFTCPTN